MPIYEYKCNICGKINEVLVNPGDTEKITCDCGSSELTKQFSRVYVSGGRSSSHACTSCSDHDSRNNPPPCAGSKTCGL